MPILDNFFGQKQMAKTFRINFDCQGQRTCGVVSPHQVQDDCKIVDNRTEVTTDFAGGKIEKKMRAI